MSSPTVRTLGDKAEIEALLARERVWAVYALGDLDDGLYEQCEWYAAGDALAMVFKGLDMYPLFTIGDVSDVEAILETAMLRPRIYLGQRREHLSAVEKYYRCAEPHWMWRMVMRRKPDTRMSTTLPVVPLGMERLAGLRALYASENAAMAFAPYQLAMGYFYGIEQDRRLVSVAGVHLVSHAQRVADVGNVFTHPDYRGRGYAARCTEAVVSGLQGAGIETIILNVDQSKHGAIRIYERLGFETYCDYVRGHAERKQS